MQELSLKLMSLLSCMLVEFVMLLPMKLLDTRHAIGMTETPVAGPAFIQPVRLAGG
jgi:hypothetical protein